MPQLWSNVLLTTTRNLSLYFFRWFKNVRGPEGQSYIWNYCDRLRGGVGRLEISCLSYFFLSIRFLWHQVVCILIWDTLPKQFLVCVFQRPHNLACFTQCKSISHHTPYVLLLPPGSYFIGLAHFTTILGLKKWWHMTAHTRQPGGKTVTVSPRRNSQDKTGDATNVDLKICFFSRISIGRTARKQWWRQGNPCIL